MQLFALIFFLCAYAVLSFLWALPPVVGLVYAVASVLCFATYAFDKAAAAGGRRRVRESTLLALDLVCGWPGGALAQLLLRHKTAKFAFQWRFWLLVLLNSAALTGAAWLMRPLP
jgi:uncharacterized membrane protein YsdA (DUF1294 family)